MDNDKLLDPVEARKVLRCGLNRIYEIFSRPDFPAVKTGTKKLFVRRGALIQWLKNQEQGKVDVLSYLGLLFENGNITKAGFDAVRIGDAFEWFENVRAGEMTREEFCHHVNGSAKK